MKNQKKSENNCKDIIKLFESEIVKVSENKNKYICLILRIVLTIQSLQNLLDLL